jgi:hypothetical protein
VIDRGVLFIATGNYALAATAAAESVRKYCPDLPIHLFTDNPDVDARPFDRVSPIENPHLRSKVDYLASTPFRNTLYLDTDIRVVADIREIFDLLERFDVALAHAQARNSSFTQQAWRRKIPDAFPQMNSGVLLYRNTSAVMALLDEWRRQYHEAGFKRDQITLRELLWLSDLRIATLPPEYNVRYAKYLRVWKKQEAIPKILHFARFHAAVDPLQQTFARRVRNALSNLMHRR